MSASPPASAPAGWMRCTPTARPRRACGWRRGRSGLEWKDTGLGNYNNRQLRAHWLDQVIALAEQRGITIVLGLIPDREFRAGEGGLWSYNPLQRGQRRASRYAAGLRHQCRGEALLQTAPALHRRALGLLARHPGMGVLERDRDDPHLSVAMRHISIMKRRDGRLAPTTTRRCRQRAHPHHDCPACYAASSVVAGASRAASTYRCAVSTSPANR